MSKINLSPFICKELVYDYLIGSLSNDRRAKFHEFLKEDESLKKSLELYKHSLQYIGELKKVEMSEEYFKCYEAYLEKPKASKINKKVILKADKEVPKIKTKVLEPKKNWQEVGKKLISLSYPGKENVYVRKSVEAFFLALVVLLLVRNIPDGFFNETSNEVVSSIVLEKQDINLRQSEEVSEADSLAANESSLDEEVDADRLSMDSSKVPESSDDPNLIKLESKLALSKAQQLKSNEEANTQETLSASAEKSQVGKKEKSVLYRSVIYVDDMESVSLAFLAFLSERGASKAGNVELGWEKPKARYFHFHIKEEFKSPMISFLNPYGQIKLDKVDHWRQVPDGKMRVIIEIRQKGTN